MHTIDGYALFDIFKGKRLDGPDTSLKDVLSGKIYRIIEEAENLLKEIYKEFEEYTDHSLKHTNRVLRNYDLIITRPLLENLDIYELFFLIAATYLHDIGMVNMEGITDYAIPKKIKNLKIARSDFIRKYHHLRTAEFIIKNYASFGLEEKEAQIIANICKGHRVEDLTNKEEFPLKMPFKTNHTINIALLSLLLKLADELDLTFERTPKILLDFIPLRSRISKLEWEKQDNTIGIAIDPEDPTTILCNAKCKRPETFRLLRKISNKINTELDLYPDLLSFHGNKNTREQIPRKFRMKIDTQGFLPYDFKFTVDRNAIFGLLGENMYANKFDSIREALKNSIDTCRYKAELADPNTKPYNPKIEVNFDEKRKILEVSDNGLGMDKFHIDNYLTVIGRSFYHSSEFKETRHKFRPLSELGIGILSYFLIANKIEIETKAEFNDAMRIVIDDNLDYFLVFPSSKYMEGTKITLHLKDEIFDESRYRDEYIEYGTPDKKLDFGKVVRRYARHIEFPIYYKKGSETSTIEAVNSADLFEKYVSKIGNNLVQIKNNTNSRDRKWFESAFASIRKILRTRRLPELSIISKAVHEDGLEGTVGIVMAKDKQGKLIHWDDLPAQFLFHHGHILSHNGILISENPLLFDDTFYHAESFLIDIDIKYPIHLDNSRNHLRDRGERYYLIHRILANLCDLVATYLKTNKVVDSRTRDLNNDMIYQFEDRKGYVHELPEFQKLLRDHLIFECVSKKSVEYLNSKEVKRDRVIFVNLPAYLNTKAYVNIVRSSKKFKSDKKYILTDFRDISESINPCKEIYGIRDYISPSQYDKLFSKKEEIGPTQRRYMEKYNI